MIQPQSLFVAFGHDIKKRGSNRGVQNMRYSVSVQPAPDFPDGLQWFNTKRPRSVLEFRGKVLLIDFRPYCCNTHMYAIPPLKKLARKYGNELAVVAVHSPQPGCNHGHPNIMQTIQRHGICHPVAVDQDLKTWRKYSLSRWPVTVLIDPLGRLTARHSSRDIFPVLDRQIKNLITEFDSRNLINRQDEFTPSACSSEDFKSPSA